MKKCAKRTTIHDIEHIRTVYSKYRSIEKTIEITGWSRNTVHKYVQDLSRQHPSSTYNHRHVLQLDKNTNKVIEEHNDLASASRETKVSISNIAHCLNKDTNTAGGYCWIYKDQYKKGV